MTRKNMAEKADYLQTGGSNINICIKYKGLCLGAGVLTKGSGGHKQFCHISRGVKIFFQLGGGRKKICTPRENVTAPPPNPGNK